MPILINFNFSLCQMFIITIITIHYYNYILQSVLMSHQNGCNMVTVFLQ